MFRRRLAPWSNPDRQLAGVLHVAAFVGFFFPPVFATVDVPPHPRDASDVSLQDLTDAPLQNRLGQAPRPVRRRSDHEEEVVELN